MTVRLPENLDLRPFAAVVTLAVLFVAVLATYESRTFDWPPYVEGPPELSSYGQLRSLTIFALSAVILWGLRRTGVGRRHLDSARQPAGWADMAPAGLALAFIAVFLASPAQFNLMALEDGPVEWASFAALVASPRRQSRPDPAARGSPGVGSWPGLFRDRHGRGVLAAAPVGLRYA